LKRGDGKAGIYNYKKEKNNVSNDESKNKNERSNRFKTNIVNNIVNNSSSSEKSYNSHKSIDSEQSLAKKYNCPADIFRVDEKKLNKDIRKINKNVSPRNEKVVTNNYSDY